MTNYNYVKSALMSTQPNLTEWEVWIDIPRGDVISFSLEKD